jgi:hypothetical protein
MYALSKNRPEADDIGVGVNVQQRVARKTRARMAGGEFDDTTRWGLEASF